MRHALILALLWPVAAGAGPFDGLYRPNYDWALAWDCKSIGQDGGALAIEDQTMRAVENTCDLTEPVEIRDMEAVLYDASCTGEGGASEGRIMLMAHEFGIYVIRDGFVLDWIACEAG
ncbi:MAG TPA: hypothetical protein DIU07_02510 [Rhodobacteraceae bacterium]|nr:hypothetical protein [Paracoccaceae bacterium]